MCTHTTHAQTQVMEEKKIDTEMCSLFFVKKKIAISNDAFTGMVAHLSCGLW